MKTCQRCNLPVLHGQWCKYHYAKLVSLGGTRMLPAEPVVQRINQLHANGWSLAEIARRAGLNVDTLVDLRCGERTHVRRSTVKGIWSIPMFPDLRRVNTIVLRRRCYGLMRIGYTLRLQEKYLGWYAGRLNQVLKRDTASHDDYEAICELYDALSGTPGPSQRAIDWAKNRGWPAPLEWDEGDIDNPDAQPYDPSDDLRHEYRKEQQRLSWQERKNGYYRLVDTAPLREHWDKLAALGWTRGSIAKATGINKNTLRGVHRRRKIHRTYHDTLLALPLVSPDEYFQGAHQ